MKKFLIFFQKKNFSYISGNGTLHFPASVPKIFSKKFLIFFPALKRFLHFLKKPLIFWKRKPQKNLYISGNGTFLYLRRRNFLILPEMELSYTSGNGIFLYLRRRNFLILPETELSYISGKVYSEPWYIQNQKHIQNTVKYLRSNILQK